MRRDMQTSWVESQQCAIFPALQELPSSDWGTAAARAVKTRRAGTKEAMKRESIFNVLKGLCEWVRVIAKTKVAGKSGKVVRTAGEAERAEALRADSTLVLYCYLA